MEFIMKDNDSGKNSTFTNFLMVGVLLSIIYNFYCIINYYFGITPSHIVSLGKAIFWASVRWIIGLLVLSVFFCIGGIPGIVLFFVLGISLLLRIRYNRLTRSNEIQKQEEERIVSRSNDDAQIARLELCITNLMDEYDLYFKSYESRKAFYAWFGIDEISGPSHKRLRFPESSKYVTFVDEYDDYDRLACLQSYSTNQKMCWIDAYSDERKIEIIAKNRRIEALQVARNKKNTTK